MQITLDIGNQHADALQALQDRIELGVRYQGVMSAVGSREPHRRHVQAA